MSQPAPQPDSPPLPKAVVFVDGQNLVHDAERQFGSTYPDFDIVKLSRAVCESRQWALTEIFFYTGTYTERQNRRWSIFWNNKKRAMTAAKVKVVTKPLKEREATVMLYSHVSVEFPPGNREPYSMPDEPWVTHGGFGIPHGTVVKQAVFTEKGIDVSIAVDAIKYAIAGATDVFLFFSRDADLQPAVKEVQAIGRSRQRRYTTASAFPDGPNAFGIPDTVPVPFGRDLYLSCLDPANYFPRHS